MTIAWAFVLMSWTSAQPLIQVGPFHDLDQCNEARRMVLQDFQENAARFAHERVILTHCFKVIH